MNKKLLILLLWCQVSRCKNIPDRMFFKTQTCFWFQVVPQCFQLRLWSEASSSCCCWFSASLDSSCGHGETMVRDNDAFSLKKLFWLDSDWSKTHNISYSYIPLCLPFYKRASVLCVSGFTCANSKFMETFDHFFIFSDDVSVLKMHLLVSFCLSSFRPSAFTGYSVWS